MEKLKKIKLQYIFMLCFIIGFVFGWFLTNSYLDNSFIVLLKDFLEHPLRIIQVIYELLKRIIK